MRAGDTASGAAVCEVVALAFEPDATTVIIGCESCAAVVAATAGEVVVDTDTRACP